MKTCYLDLDGVIADFVGGACRLHGIPDPYLDPAMLGVWRFENRVGLTAEQFWGPMGYGFWKGLDPTPDGAEIVTMCMAAYGRERVWLMTSPCRTPGCKEGKYGWVCQHFPDFSGRLIFESEKFGYAEPDAELVDDSDRNVDAFREHGGQAILVPRIWNSLHGQRHRTVDYLKEQL